MRIGAIGVLGLSLLVAGCGSTETERAATGALIGAGSGGLIAGPIGAVAGLAAGGVVGTAMPEDATTIAANAFGLEHRYGRQGLAAAGLGPSSTATASSRPAASSSSPAMSGSSESATVPPGLVKEAQQDLKRQGLYTGRIDGIIGPKTHEALAIYQRQQGLPQTAALDHATMDKLNLVNGNANAASSSSNSGQALNSPAQIRRRLASEGYSNISHIRHVGSQMYAAEATKDGTDYNLQVDAQSGRVVAQQPSQSGAASNQPAQGSSTQNAAAPNDNGQGAMNTPEPGSSNANSAAPANQNSGTSNPNPSPEGASTTPPANSNSTNGAASGSNPPPDNNAPAH